MSVPKFLTVCSHGNCRSVHMATILKEVFKVEAIAIGVHTSTVETIETLYAWCDHMLVMHEELVDDLPETCREKLKVCCVGEDRFWQGLHPELAQLCHEFAVQLLGPQPEEQTPHLKALRKRPIPPAAKPSRSRRREAKS
jgi:protein-tyrosine-phosphatase